MQVKWLLSSSEGSLLFELLKCERIVLRVLVGLLLQCMKGAAALVRAPPARRLRVVLKRRPH